MRMVLAAIKLAIFSHSPKIPVTGVVLPVSVQSATSSWSPSPEEIGRSHRTQHDRCIYSRRRLHAWRKRYCMMMHCVCISRYSREGCKRRGGQVKSGDGGGVSEMGGVVEVVSPMRIPARRAGLAVQIGQLSMADVSHALVDVRVVF
jgi:hypothetical protein